MKIKLVVFLAVIFMATPLMADKPEWAGKKGKPTSEQVESHRSSMQSKEVMEQEREKKDKKRKEKKQKKDEKREKGNREQVEDREETERPEGVQMREKKEEMEKREVIEKREVMENREGMEQREGVQMRDKKVEVEKQAKEKSIEQKGSGTQQELTSEQLRKQLNKGSDKEDEPVKESKPWWKFGGD